MIGFFCFFILVICDLHIHLAVKSRKQVTMKMYDRLVDLHFVYPLIIFWLLFS